MFLDSENPRRECANEKSFTALCTNNCRRCGMGRTNKTMKHIILRSSLSYWEKTSDWKLPDITNDKIEQYAYNILWSFISWYEDQFVCHQYIISLVVIQFYCLFIIIFNRIVFFKSLMGKCKSYLTFTGISMIVIAILPMTFISVFHCSKLRENFGLRSQIRKYERDVLCQHRCV